MISIIYDPVRQPRSKLMLRILPNVPLLFDLPAAELNRGPFVIPPHPPLWSSFGRNKGNKMSFFSHVTLSWCLCSPQLCQSPFMEVGENHSLPPPHPHPPTALCYYECILRRETSLLTLSKTDTKTYTHTGKHIHTHTRTHTPQQPKCSLLNGLQ